MSTQLEQRDEGGRKVDRPVYERPVLIAVGNLHDLLAAGGTQNADPVGGPNPPLCTSGGLILDNVNC
jgi:hypothetical protein